MFISLFSTLIGTRALTRCYAMLLFCASRSLDEYRQLFLKFGMAIIGTNFTAIGCNCIWIKKTRRPESFDLAFLGPVVTASRPFNRGGSLG